LSLFLFPVPCEPVTEKASLIKGRFGGFVYILCAQCTLRTGSTPVFTTRRRLSGCRFFLFPAPCEPVTEKASLIKGRFGGIVYILCAMHIAHRFDPGIHHKATTFGLSLFFVSCTMRTGDRESLPYQREVWRDCLYLVCNAHCAPVRPRYPPPPPSFTSFGGGKLLNTYLKQRIFVCFFGITRGFFYLCGFILVRFFTFN